MPSVDIFPILLTIVALLLNSFHRWMFVQLFSTMHTGETFLGSPKLWPFFAWGDRSKTYFSRGKYFKTPAQCKSAGKKALGNCVTHKVWGLNHVLTGSLFTQLSLWGACLRVKPKTWNGTKVKMNKEIWYTQSQWWDLTRILKKIYKSFKTWLFGRTDRKELGVVLTKQVSYL